MARGMLPFRATMVARWPEQTRAQLLGHGAHQARGELPRCLGIVDGRTSGPTVVIVGGLHGNEPAGLFAAWDVLDELRERSEVLRGRVVAFSGNRRALVRGVRFIARDLNRRWDAPNLERLVGSPWESLEDEDREQRELCEAFLLLERDSPVLAFLDLHTTSGRTEPFVCFEDTPDNRALAAALPVVGVMGFEKTVHASMLSWCVARGHVGLSFEAGQHEDPATRPRHVASVWTLLVAAGVIDAAHVPDLEMHRDELARAVRGPRRSVEVRYRHVVKSGDGFEMIGHFETFDRVEAGQVVARDRAGLIRTPEPGLLLMPRYQPQGEDGFFVARELVPPSTPGVIWRMYGPRDRA